MFPVFTRLFWFVYTYFLINWLDDPDGDDLYDVVNSKLVVPPDGIDILDVAPGSICKVAYTIKPRCWKQVCVCRTLYTCMNLQWANGDQSLVVLPNSSLCLKQG